ncbi:HDOD domain-containing protein [Methylosarcina fibrata]|uniref:HDOD domain-containing protein n=1 Tax=Methylosarcina fibrata TaxID=105972 RepID=UPI000371B992|nr:HDOD domain-containing protein [Methylosarcina fibrata]
MFWKFLKKLTDKPQHSETKSKDNITSLPIAFLQKLIPIGELPVDELEAAEARVIDFNPGEIIFKRGDLSDSLTYLYAGEVYLEAGNGNGYGVDAATFKACYPLSTNAVHHFSAIAKSPASIVYLPLSLLRRSSDTVLDHRALIHPDDVPAELKNSLLFNGICEAFRNDELQVPALPDVVLRLRRALQKEISIGEAVKIINLDPVISSKLIQVVNSPVYRTFDPITNSYDAVFRLGLKTTQNLVMTISMYNLFQSKNRKLNERIQQIWKQSIQVASLSYTLAWLGNHFNADEALLAGLTHNIGVLPIITYAESLGSGHYTDEEMDQTIEVLQGLLGKAILQKWHFPERLHDIPIQSGNWYHDENPELQLSDIVLLARFHSQLGKTPMQNLPPLNTLPAYSKLGESALTPSMSLQALHDAKQQVSEALNFFRA